MRYSPGFLRFAASLAISSLAASSLAAAQRPAQAQIPTQQPAPAKAPAVIDLAGQEMNLETSEGLFYIAVALNACGYNNGLDQSDPIRMHVREQVNHAAGQSAEARNARDQLCTFIDQHRLAGAGVNLAQYISLALYLTPPPALAPSVEDADMPPDSTQVEGILPLLRTFAQAIDLHLIWVSNRPAYDEEITRLHDPLTKMIFATNLYLKMPVGGYEGRRFLVVLEPMLSPSEVNARVYGSNYVVVASPVDGVVHMREVRHTYLHYEIEPLLYAQSGAMTRLLPFLKVVHDAPLDFRYRSDIVPLVVECMIRAVEARTMQTGVSIPNIPANTPHSELAPLYQAREAATQKDSAPRQASVDRSMRQGFVLTQYFYNQLIVFEKTPVSFKESIGEMVYGMDVPEELGRVRHIEFAEPGSSDEGSSEVVQRAPVRPAGLDLAELDLMKGDAQAATQLSQAALSQHTADPARANFILARADLENGRMEDAQSAFQQSVKLSHEARIVAWSHIYLGRILDVEDKRDEALVEYKAALASRDGQPDTKEAAEKGLKTPFALPKRQGADPNADSNTDANTNPNAKPDKQP
jgi:hypothetical protein